MQTKAGFVSIIGKPNVGKSTLLNRLVGQKLAGVSARPQTTRQTIHGILTTPKGQIVFLDTPGIHAPKDHLGKRMMNAAKKTHTEADLLFWMVLPAQPGPDEKRILADLLVSQRPIVLLVNKIDTVAKLEALPVLDAYQKLHPFAALFPISAATGDNVPELVNKAFEFLPENPILFPPDQVSDQTERFLASEMIREKIFRLTGAEIPYASAVVINEFKERSERLAVISATIFVEKASQKKIVIGKNCQMIKKIGEASRKAIETFLGKKVFLELWVKERENWKKDDSFLNQLEQGEGL